MKFVFKDVQFGGYDVTTNCINLDNTNRNRNYTHRISTSWRFRRAASL